MLATRGRVAIVHRAYPWEESNLNELEELCNTAGYEVVYRLFQRRYPHPEYNIGPSKLGELKQAVKNLGISKVIFENELKPLQEYNLAKILSVEVITRIRLILEIFTQHASNLEAKLQIKLAELKYELPRAREKVKLAKRGEQPGFHGLGAYEADVYYEEINRRIHKLSEKLEEIKRKKLSANLQRRVEGVPVISLAGYTNAGKTTLFNTLTGYEAEVSPQMFTTLSTKRRLAKIDGKPVYVSDTVGFIKNVPTLLISSFMSTLMEIAEADLILLVIDASEPVETMREKLDASLSTLRQIGVTNTPIIIVLNKNDIAPPTNLEEAAKVIGQSYPVINISAKRGDNIEGLHRVVSQFLNSFVLFKASLTYSDEAKWLLQQAYMKGRVIDLKYQDSTIEIIAETPLVVAEKIRRLTNPSGFRIIKQESDQ
ncbi:MAG: GTPase HflX [Nitrososphaerota archaeon]